MSTLEAINRFIFLFALIVFDGIVPFNGIISFPLKTKYFHELKTQPFSPLLSLQENAL